MLWFGENLNVEAKALNSVKIWTFSLKRSSADFSFGFFLFYLIFMEINVISCFGNGFSLTWLKCLNVLNNFSILPWSANESSVSTEEILEEHFIRRILIITLIVMKKLEKREEKKKC